jgi:putative ABC transport system ATP-binding protein
MKLILKNIHKQYRHKTIIEHGNYIFESGKIYGLKGPSGSGKSTILNLIARFDKRYRGTIQYNQTDIKKISQHQYFANIIGYLFQNYALLDNDTVYTNLSIAFPKKAGLKHKMIMRDALKKVNLTDEYLSRKVYELSGGEQQRVAIARMLIKKPQIILVDEPTAALDIDNSRDILKNGLLQMKNPNTIIIIASHDPIVFEYTDVDIDVTQL